MASAKVHLMGTVLPGFEEVAASELLAKIPGSRVIRQERGKVHFHKAPDFQALLKLRTFDNLYASLWTGEVGPHKVHLPEVVETLSHLKGTDVIHQYHENLPNNPTIFVNASRVGKHTYSRFDLAKAAMDGILMGRPRWRLGTGTEHDLEFRLDLDQNAASLYVRLTDQLFRYRGDDHRFTQAALRPTVAHALVWMLGPDSEETFLDPFCGSGSIVAERAAYPSRWIRGGDISQDAVDAARANIPGDEVGAVGIDPWDARNLPLPAHSVDSVISNLPFGRQILEPAEIEGLYTDCMKELARVLKPGARGLLLTDQREQLLKAADAAGIRMETGPQLSLKGLHPWVFRISVPVGTPGE